MAKNFLPVAEEVLPGTESWPLAWEIPVKAVDTDDDDDASSEPLPLPVIVK